jgi:hypothetical protein
MGTIMLIVAVSRGLAIPGYLKELGLISLSNPTVTILGVISFITMCIALGVGAIIILGSMWRAKRAEAAKTSEYALEESLG